MTMLEIGGRRVEVGDGFAAMSPAEQQRTVDEIAQSFGSAAPQLQAQAPVTDGPSMLGSAATGAVSGMTFGFDDEIAAGLKTGLGFAGDYGKELENQRAIQGRYREANPIAAGVGEIGGALATAPLTGALNVMRGAGLGARVASSAATGAAYGGVYGAGTSEGNLADRAAGAGIGAAFGGAAGSAAPLIMQGASSLVAPLRGMINPQKEAARRVGSALALDKVPGAEPLRTAADHLRLAQSNDVPLIAADVGDETTRAVARSAANTSPTARTALQDATGSRWENQTERVQTALQRITGAGGDTGGKIETLQKAARTANAPAYRRAYNDGSSGIWSENLEQLASSPTFVEAMRRVATKTGKDRAVVEGYGGFNPGVQVTDDGRILFPTGKGGVPAYPDLQYWDYVQRELRNESQKAYRAGAKGDGSTLEGLHRKLIEELDTAVPIFRDARRGAAQFFGAEDALEAGRVAARDRRMANPDLARGLSKMNGAERQLFQEGYANEMLESVSRMGDTRNVVGSPLFASQQMRQRHALALGPGKAKEIETLTQLENIMNKTKAAVEGNSTTVRQLVEMGVAGVGGGIWSGGNIADPRTYLPVLLTLGARRFGGKINANVVREVGELLASGDPDKLSRAADILAQNKTLNLALQHADEYLTKAASPAAVQGGQELVGAQ